MKKINRLIAYGCSITSGMELADYNLMPSMSMSDIDNIKINHGIEYWKDILESKNSVEKINHEESRLAWPRWLSDRLNIDYINRANPGSNSQSFIFHLEKDLSSGFIKSDDLIIVGHSEYSRWFYIDNDSRPRHCCPGGSLKQRWPSATFHDEFVTHVMNDYQLIYQWFHDIKYLEMLSKNIESSLLQVFCLGTFKSELNMRSESFFSMFDSTDSFDSILDHDYSFDSIVDWNNKKHLHPFTHPKVEFHKIFAEHVYKKILDRNV